MTASTGTPSKTLSRASWKARADTRRATIPEQGEQGEQMEEMVRCPDCWREVRGWVDGEAVNFCPRCQFPLKIVGEKYRLETRLGAGAFGTVYRARHLEIDNVRAIKVMRWDTANSKAPEEWTSGRRQKKQREFEARFEKEVRLTALLAAESWHIVRLDDAGADDVLGLYYIMEYLEGAPLRHLMSEWPFLARRIAFSIMEQVCRGVATAHRMGVIHRDLKPENIILLKQEDAGRFVKILDFGLAKMLGDGALNLTSRPMGTPLYMSPEQCANRNIDQRADIYALGGICFHLLAGTPPFHDVQETPQLFMRHLQAPPPSLRERCPAMEVPEGLDKALQYAMAKSPDARPKSVEEFWNSIAPFARWHEQIWRYGAAQADSQATFFPTGEAITPPNLWPAGDTRLTPHHLDDDGVPQFDSSPHYNPYTSRRAQRRREWQAPLIFITVILLCLGLAWGVFRTILAPTTPGATQAAKSTRSTPLTPGARTSPPARVQKAPQKAPARRVAMIVRQAPARPAPARRTAVRRKMSKIRRKRARRKAPARRSSRAWIASVKVKGAASWPGAQRAMIRAGWLEKTNQAPGAANTLVVAGPKIRISRSFWLWRTEVSQGQFQALMGYNPARFKRCGARCPVETVSWHEAAAFANALSLKQSRTQCYSCTGKGRGVWCRPYPQYKGKQYSLCKGWRLPTEAEWEYAYRAGTKTSFYTGACMSGDQANFDGRSPSPGCPSASKRGRTLSSGRFSANPWGLYDMAGNVWEWVYDGYQSSQTLTSPNPVQEVGSRRVLRGGGWYSPAAECHANARESFVANKRSLILGFRIARTR